MDGVFFTAVQLERAGELEGEPGLVGWWVELPDASYRGRAVAPAEWTADMVLEALNRKALEIGERVVQGRLYSRARLDEA